MTSRRAIQFLTRQSWLSVSLRRHIVNRVVRNAASAFECEFAGLRYRGRFDSHIDRDVFFLGAYDQGTLRLIELLSRERAEPVLFDIGANVGVHTMACARFFKSTHSFEPFLPLARELRNHVGINALQHVFVHKLGLGDVDTVATYAAPADGRAGYGGFDNHDPNLTKFELPMRRGDTYLAEQRIERADVIKIDVEGSEHRVIAGMRRFLEQARPAVIFEYWPTAWSDGFAAGFPAHYRFWLLHEQTSRLKILADNRLFFMDASSATDGMTIVALPEEWPVPTEVTIQK